MSTLQRGDLAARPQCRCGPRRQARLHRPVSESPMASCRADAPRSPTCCSRLGVRREERVAMMMLDTVDFPIVFLGAIRAGIVPVPLNTLLTAEQYAYVLADSRARVLFVSEALLPVVKDSLGRMPDLERMSWSSARTRTATCCSPRSSRRRATASPPPRPIPTSPPSGSIRPARPACRRACGTCIPTCRPRQTPMRKQVLGINENDLCLSAAKLFFAYGLGNALTFPMSVGASTVLNADRPTPAADVLADEQARSDALLRRADAVCGDAQRRER